MREIDESKTVYGVSYYIPNLGVHKESYTSTETRVAFHASMNCTFGYSLNDIIHKEPETVSLLVLVLTNETLCSLFYSLSLERVILPQKSYLSRVASQSECKFSYI